MDNYTKWFMIALAVMAVGAWTQTEQAEAAYTPNPQPSSLLIQPAAKGGANVLLGISDDFGTYREIIGANNYSTPVYLTMIAYRGGNAGEEARIKIATGAAGSEVGIVSNIEIDSGVYTAAGRMGFLYFPSAIKIPANTRVSIAGTTNVGSAPGTVYVTTYVYQ